MTLDPRQAPRDDSGLNWLEFIASIIGSLAWPAAFVVALAVFRTPLGKLIERIKGARFKGVEFDLTEVQEEIEAADLPEPAPDQAAQAARTEALARVDPRSAVISAWIPVETELRLLSEQHELRGRVKDLEKAGVITAELARIVRDLRRLRHEAVHASEFDISETEARKYQEATARVAAALRLLRGESPTA
ncbi:MAG: hypothetical protein M3540_12455 [Actinomycetota bacterium]|nr:hypothetical protein [Actinomycetota bacterium]